jgi:hypothetical protein
MALPLFGVYGFVTEKLDWLHSTSTRTTMASVVYGTLFVSRRVVQTLLSRRPADCVCDVS